MKTILVFLKHKLRAIILLRLRWQRAYDALLSVERLFLGRKVRLEVCSKCQLACPSCSTAQGVNREGVVGSGSLKPEDFQKFVEQNKGIRRIEISKGGEIFLNPRLVEILGARRRTASRWKPATAST